MNGKQEPEISYCDDGRHVILLRDRVDETILRSHAFMSTNWRRIPPPASVLFTHEPDFHSTFGVDVPCITVLFARSSTFMTRQVDVEIHMSDDPAEKPTTEGVG